MIRRLLVRWLWPEIYRKIYEPEWKSTERLVEMGLLRDRSKDEAIPPDPDPRLVSWVTRRD